MSSTAKMVYLLSQYPAVNTTYLLREVRQLRACGFELPVISVRPPDRLPAEMTQDEREEAATTFYLLPFGLMRTVGPLLRAAVTRPGLLLKGLLMALACSLYDLKRLSHCVAYFLEAVQAGDWMMKRRISHVHTHYSSTVAWLMTIIYPVTMSMTIHGYEEFENPLRFRLTEKIKAAAFIRTISSYARGQLMKACDPAEWNRIEIAPLGIDPQLFQRRTHNRNGNDETEILCVGTLMPVKGQCLLVAAVERLVNAGRKVRLRLVGDGPDRTRIERMIMEGNLRAHVILEGRQNQDRVRELYQQTDIFALASFAEGVPVVLMEAMAMEIPCVATRITGIPELIRDGQDGLLVTPADADEMAAAIARLIDDHELRHHLTRSARQRVLEKYNLHHNTSALAELFARKLLPEDC